MSKTKSIFKKEKVVEKAPSAKELTDEIRSIKLTQQKFNETNNCQNYIVVVFSTETDKEKFLDNIGITDHTFVDGYKIAKKMGVEPVRPEYKLPLSLDEKH